MVEQTVNIMEYIPFGDCVIFIMRAEVFQRPIGDVLAAICPVLIVGVEGEALGITCGKMIRQLVDHQTTSPF